MYTSDIRGAGTDASVWVILAGDQGVSPHCDLLGPPNADPPAFGRGAVDSFEVQATELGHLHSITIGMLVRTNDLVVIIKFELWRSGLWAL